MTAAANKTWHAMRIGHEAWREKTRRRRAVMTDEQLREALLCDLHTSRRMLMLQCGGDPAVTYLLDRILSICAVLDRLPREIDEETEAEIEALAKTPRSLENGRGR